MESHPPNHTDKVLPSHIIISREDNIRYEETNKYPWLSSEGDSQGSGTYNKFPQIVIDNDGNE